MKRLAIVMVFLASAAWAAGPTNDDCLGCHGMEGLEGVTARGKTLNLLVPADALKGSAHESFACIDCHTGARNWTDAPHAPGGLKLACSTCHEDVQKIYEADDVHGKAHARKDAMAPYCNGCHGGHRILPLSSIPQMIGSGEITHAMTIAGFHLMELRAAAD